MSKALSTSMLAKFIGQRKLQVQVCWLSSLVNESFKYKYVGWVHWLTKNLSTSMLAEFIG